MKPTSAWDHRSEYDGGVTRHKVTRPRYGVGFCVVGAAGRSRDNGTAKGARLRPADGQVARRGVRDLVLRPGRCQMTFGIGGGLSRL